MDTFPQFPRIMGFEVPLSDEGSGSAVEPIVATLDVQPTENWTKVFRREVQNLEGALAEANLSIEGDRIAFYASAEDGRSLAMAVRTFVEHVSQVRQAERMRGD